MSDDPIDAFFMKVIKGLLVLILFLLFSQALSIVCMRYQSRVIDNLRSELTECQMTPKVEGKEGK